MPIRLEDSTELLQHAGEEFVGGVKGMWEGFTDFALQDNVLEVAVGLMCICSSQISFIDHSDIW